MLLRGVFMEEERQEPAAIVIKKEIFQWVLSIGAAVILALALKTYIFATADVDGVSMFPTLANNDKLFVEKISVITHSMKRGEIIIFDSKNEHHDIFVKRVIGVEGDRILLKDGKVYLNGNLLNEPYLKDNTYTNPGPVLQNNKELTVQKNCIFVMGDNRGVSYDSRFIGQINIKDIKGHVIFRSYPFNEMKGF